MRYSKIFLVAIACICSFDYAVVAGPGSGQAKNKKAAFHEKTPKVVFISVDGWHSALVEEMPAVKEMLEKGSWTLEAKAPIPPITVVSHAVIFTGAVPEKNGVVRYEPKNLENWKPLKVRTVFQAIHIRNKKTAAFVQKKKVAALLPREAVKEFGIFSDKKKIIKNTCAAINAVPEHSLIFIHFEDIDAMGHAYGWLSPEQKIAALEIDKAIADLSSCARQSEKKLKIPVVMIMFGDHGGHKKTHGAKIKSDLEVPWIAAGKGIKAGYKIKGGVRLLDTAPTILKILGYDFSELLPDAEGRVVKEIFE